MYSWNDCFSPPSIDLPLALINECSGLGNKKRKIKCNTNTGTSGFRQWNKQMFINVMQVTTQYLIKIGVNGENDASHNHEITTIYFTILPWSHGLGLQNTTLTSILYCNICLKLNKINILLGTQLDRPRPTYWPTSFGLLKHAQNELETAYKCIPECHGFESCATLH